MLASHGEESWQQEVDELILLARRLRLTGFDDCGAGQGELGIEVYGYWQSLSLMLVSLRRFRPCPCPDKRRDVAAHESKPESMRAPGGGAVARFRQ